MRQCGHFLCLLLCCFVKPFFIFPAGCWQVFIATAAAARRRAYPARNTSCLDLRTVDPYPCHSHRKSVKKTWLEIKTFHINFSTAHTHESKLNAFIKQFSFSLLYFSHHSPKNYIGAQCKFVVNCCKLLKPTSGAAKEETFTWPGRRHSIASMDVALGVKVELGGILMWVRRPREHQTLPPPISGQSQTVRVFDTLSSNGNARHGNLAPISAAVREMCALISAVNFEPEASST